MGIRLTEQQLLALKSKANIENDREIYYIRFDGQEIIINGSWSIKRGNKPIDQEIISAIEVYCTKKNIEWEYASEYATWCD